MNSVRVLWEEPKDADVVLRGYLVTWGQGNPSSNERRLDQKQRSFEIVDLLPNTEYVLREHLRECSAAL